jgi:hypothetical protein
LGNPAAELTVATLVLRFYERFVRETIDRIALFVEKTITLSQLEVFSW